MAEADKVLSKENVELKEELRELKREIEWGGGEEERREAERQVLRVMDDIAVGVVMERVGRLRIMQSCGFSTRCYKDRG